MRRLGTFLSALGLFLLFATGLGLGLGLARWWSRPPGLQLLGTASVVRQVQTLADLVAVKYVLEKVVILNAPPQSTLGQWVQGDNRVLLLAHGIVKAGINLAELSATDVQISGSRLTLRLPPARITDCYLDEQQTQVIDWKLGFLRAFDKDLEQTARRAAVTEIRAAALESGILRDASARAQEQLTALLHQAGFTTVTFAGPDSLKSLAPATGRE